MMKLDTNKHYMVLGLGATGVSCARYLHHMGCSFSVMDSREAPAGVEEFKRQFPDIEVHLNGLNAELLLACDEIVISPGICRQEPEVLRAIEAGIRVTCDIQLLVNQLACDSGETKVVAITGSNGKSTVTTLVGDICQEADLTTVVAGNIGLPVLDAWMQYRTHNVDVYVLELSSFQLESCDDLCADVAAYLNLSEDHLDRYPSYQDYAAAKQRIYIGAKSAVFNLDDPATKPTQAVSRETAFSLTEPSGADFGLGRMDGGDYYYRGEQPLFESGLGNLAGRHNQLNVMAAMAIVAELGVGVSAVERTLGHFTGLPHRCNRVAYKGDIAFIDDSKATNEGAAIAALQGLADPEQKAIVLIAGGQAKGCEFEALPAAIQQFCKAVILIGESADLIRGLLPNEFKAELASSMQEAVEKALTHAAGNDIILLSPACASFDMFSGFGHRGSSFLEAALAVGAKQC